MTPVIDIRSVSKRFGAVEALREVSLTLTTGERAAFVGANGSGKTTLMRAVMGLLVVDGEVRVNGVDVRSRPETALRDVAYIPQVAPPLDAPVRELVRATATLRGHGTGETAALAAALGLDFDRIAKVRMRDLSGGTKQKLLAAMALAAQPRILVCDEPTANLDEVARHAFFALVSRRPPDAVLVLCSHRTEEARACHRAAGGRRDGGRACTPAEKPGVVAQVMVHRDALVDLRVLDEDTWDSPQPSARLNGGSGFTATRNPPQPSAGLDGESGFAPLRATCNSPEPSEIGEMT